MCVRKRLPYIAMLDARCSSPSMSIMGFRKELSTAVCSLPIVPIPSDGPSTSNTQNDRNLLVQTPMHRERAHIGVPWNWYKVPGTMYALIWYLAPGIRGVLVPSSQYRYSHTTCKVPVLVCFQQTTVVSTVF